VTPSVGGVVLSLVMLAAGCTTLNTAPPPQAATTREPMAPLHLYALDTKTVTLGHAAPEPEIAPGHAPRPGHTIGGVLPPPAPLSERHQARIVEANERYGERDYARALAAIEPAYLDERDNPFVIETYARVLYRMGERAQSFVVYRQLVDLLDTRWRTAAAEAVTVDLWFVDAYWKAGTLHMDRREWSHAVFEISRALVGGVAWAPLAEDQALSYLTRAYFELGRHAEARYYAERAVGRNPRNTYARQYLDRLAREPKER
jgi:tetratricopeptide (TPR) repeat protein